MTAVEKVMYTTASHQTGKIVMENSFTAAFLASESEVHHGSRTGLKRCTKELAHTRQNEHENGTARKHSVRW